MSISPEKTCRWQTNIWKDTLHACLIREMQIRTPEMSLHTYWSGPHLEHWQHQVLGQCGLTGPSHSLLMGLQGTAILEYNWVRSLTNETYSYIWFSKHTPKPANECLWQPYSLLPSVEATKMSFRVNGEIDCGDETMEWYLVLKTLSNLAWNIWKNQWILLSEKTNLKGYVL